jgi:hypothetical protein
MNIQLNPRSPAETLPAMTIIELSSSIVSAVGELVGAVLKAVETQAKNAHSRTNNPTASICAESLARPSHSVEILSTGANDSAQQQDFLQKKN